MLLGAQLYTVKKYIQTEKDIRFTLKEIAGMGYTTVQVSGIGKIAPELLREICDELSLKIVLTHTDNQRIINETEQVIHEHEILGCDYIGIGGMPEKYRSATWYDHFALDFKEPAKKIANAGKLFMYHNHNFEFRKMGMGNKRMIERLVEDFTPEEMGITFDTYWVQAAGGDICQWIEILKDRIHCVHLKDMTVNGFELEMAPVMEGNINFKEVLKAIEKANNTKYLIVEQDICKGSPFDCLQTSYNNLAKLGYK